MATLGNGYTGVWIPCDGQQGATVASSSGKSFLLDKPKKLQDSYRSLLPILAPFLKGFCLKDLCPPFKNVDIMKDKNLGTISRDF